MDPENRGNSQQDTPRIPHAISPSYYFSTEQAHGAGHMDTGFRRLQHGYIRNDYSHNLHHHQHHFHSQDVHEEIRREIEKERIREEIIMSEIMRRRALEAEVRRELMMEREMALRSGSDGFPYCSSPAMTLESPIRPSLLGTRAEGWAAEERLGIALEDKEIQKGRHENKGLDVSPFQTTADLRISEVKPASEGNKEKERIILLTKPDENVSGSKRKAVTPHEELPVDIIANKKSKEEWSCALCQVRATSEQALEEHVHGKKHQSKEAALRAQRGGKNYSIGLFPNKAAKSNHVAGTIDPGEEEGVKHKSQILLSEKVGEATSKKDDLPSLLENPKSEHLKKTQSEVIREVQKNEDDPKKKGCKFWCEMCQVGTLSGKVMNDHKMGKKHLSRLRSFEQNGGTGSVNQKKSSTVAYCVEEASENGKNINSEKFNQALDQASSADQGLLDAFGHEEQEGETLNSKNINKALDEVRSEDHEFLDAVEQEDHKRADIIQEEIGDVDIAKPEGDSTNAEDEPRDQEQTNCSASSIAKPQV